MDGAVEQGFFTRGVVVGLDPAPAQERLLRSYCGAARVAHNWAIAVVKDNLSTRAAERAQGVTDDQLTPALSWSAYGLGMAWNQAKDDTAPWWREVSMHAFRSGVTSASAALKNFADSRHGARAGRRVGFPRFKSRTRSVPSVSFVEINHQLSWLHPSRHGVRLMLPQSSPDPALRRRRDQLAWIHTTTSTRRLYNLVAHGRASIQKVTISYRGGRWQAAFSVRFVERPAIRPTRRHGSIVGVDAGLKHLATLSVPVAGLSDEDGHVANPEVLAGQLRRLARLDRAIARCEKGSRNRRRLLERRALLHGAITKTRALHLHRLSTALAGSFDAVAIEDLNVYAMVRSGRRLARRVADAGLGELRRQLDYKCADRGSALVVIDRFYPSSKTCSACGATRATLPLFERVYRCEACGLALDRDVNAARNLESEGLRFVALQHSQDGDDRSVAGLRPETQNAGPRRHKTGEAQAPLAAVA
jgi:putative transposase